MAVPLRVAVRIRPARPHDGNDGRVAVQAHDATSLEASVDGARRRFDFDHVFGPEVTQREVFIRCGLPLVEAVLEGTNACMFAFGQTGAGKTHTMLGPEGGRRQASQDGVLPQAAAELFRRIARAEAETRQALGAGGFSAYEVRVSFLEVYRECAFDLLHSATQNRDAASACTIREQTDPLRIYAEGAVEERVASVAQLLQLVARGAANRATAATGVHDHSSRSHALLLLTVEHRWRDVGDPDARRAKTQVSRLTLVDLAGAETMERSHGGNVDAAGVGTNLGLLVLGRVIQALANGERPPHRDSTLTRLLQTSLGGSAVTQMLTCVSPAGIDSEQTVRTLRYASSARDVRNKPQAARIVDEINADPMMGDVDDDDLSLNRRTIWIETQNFGDVFARCTGDAADPLILWVHGSGPRNSSMFWNEVVLDVARLADMNTLGLPTKFFQVAIDCPGYGRSPSDRQTIRSYPGAFLSSVVEALGRKSCVAMCGSSQGAASTFNAALECPKLALALAVCHPVGHSPQRYTSIQQPTLLIFDTEDDGHPVSVGRQMRRYLPHNRYFEFTRSVDGDWEAKYMGAELLQLLAADWQQIKGKRKAGRLDPKLPDLTRVAGGYRSWSEQHNGEYLPMGSRQGGWDAAGVEEQEQSVTGDVWRAILDAGTNCIHYQHVQSGRVSKVRPPGVQVLVERLGQGADTQRAPAVLRVGGAPEPLFEESGSEEEEEDRLERERREQQASKEEAEREHAQIECDLCHEALLDPVRLVRCRCAICKCCVETTLRYFRRCPLCDEPVQMTRRGSSTPQSDAEELSRRLAQCESEGGNLGEQLRRRRGQLAELVTARKEAFRVVVEYGNVSKAAKSKTSYTTFAKIPLVEGGPKDVATGLLAKVDFNINPGYSKPTSSVVRPDGKVGAHFEYTMARSYPCFITVHFKKELGLPAVIIEYEVQDESPTSRRLVLEMPIRALGGRRPGQATFDACPPRNGWVRCGVGSPEVHFVNASGRRAMRELPRGVAQLPAAPALERTRSQHLKDQLRALGADGDGMIEAETLALVMVSSSFSEQEALRVIEAAGVGPDGRVSFDRFVDYIHGLAWDSRSCNP